MAMVMEACIALKFFIKRYILLVIFRSYKKEHSLFMLGETRFAWNFIAIAHLLKVKGKLKQSVIDLRWEEYVRTLWNGNKSKSLTMS